MRPLTFIIGLMIIFLAVPAFSKDDYPSVWSKLPRQSEDDDFYHNGRPNPEKVQLGNLLFFDKILSGNRNISCATCHHPLAFTGDGLSLPVGEGGVGLGVTRNCGFGADAIHERVPRNAPPLFNLGAKEFRVMLRDGRIEVDPSQPSGFRSPAGDDLPPGLENALAVVAMFPVVASDEMAGQPGENSIADSAAADDFLGVWSQLEQRLRSIPEYVALFMAAFDDVNSAEDIAFVHAANAIAAFEAVAYRADNSPFDRFLSSGDWYAMNRDAVTGMLLFYGEANCASCHSGTFQTDHQFHMLGIPQIGPGKGDGINGLEDFGRERVTMNPADRYNFRTPPLRNILLTGPWGHDGAYNSLSAIILHHMDPLTAFLNYDTSQAVLPPQADLDAYDFMLHDYYLALMATTPDGTFSLPVNVSNDDIYYLMEFLYALTDPAMLDLRVDVPLSVPSGLPVVE